MSETMKYRDLYYIAKFGDGTMIDDGIRIATKIPNWNAPPVTHYELWEGSEKGNFYVGPGPLGTVFAANIRIPCQNISWVGQFWTSTTRGKVKGGPTSK